MEERENSSSETGPELSLGSLWLDRTLVGCAVVALGYLLLQIVLFRYGRDQGIYAVVAEVMVRGGAPYRDAWDFKPPGIFAVYALARLLLGPDEHGVRVLEAVGFASLVGAFMIVSRRWIGEGKAGLLGGVLAVGTQAQLEFWHTGQPESFGAVLLAWALVCATHEPSGDRARHKEIALWVGCGALYAAAAMLKPPLGGGFLVSLMVVGARVYRRESGGKVRALALVVGAFSLGGSLVVGGVTLYFVAKGALGDLYQTLFVFTPHYTKLGFRSEWFWGFVYLAFEQWFVGFSALLGVGLLLWLGLPSFGRREREGALHVMGVVTFQLVGIALQAKFFPYHYGAALPFGALLAGWGFWKLWLRVRRDMAYVLLFGLLIYLLAGARGASRDLTDTFWARSKMRLTALLHPERRDELEDYLHTVADVNAGANRQVAAWLRLHTGDDTTIFIWGFEPEIYHLARRRPASRYIYNVPQRVSWSTDESRRVLMEELHRAKPQAFVVEHRDVFPHVTGNRDDSAAALRSFSELDEFLKENYRYVLSMEDFDIYVRR